MPYTTNDSKIPPQKLGDESGGIPEIKVKTAFNGQIFITYVDHDITFSQFEDEMREICGFQKKYPFTVKWVDEEGDPCTISSELEVQEAIRLYETNKEAELTVHVEEENSFSVFILEEN